MALNSLNRRQFLQLSTLTAAGWLVGCATNPVTGESQLMLVSEQQEIELDKQNSPHQFSADYGPSQDSALNAYLNQTGRRLATLTHRPRMPYSFRAVNANYVNAYAFPGGSIAATRGILLKLENEAELAALLGHELGHVNARHTAEIMSKGMLTNALVGGVVALVGTESKYGGVAAQLGMLGSGALLASYSRDNERQADRLGMEYMVKAGYGSEGMVGLMDILRNMSREGGGVTELLFATHPMSSERYQTAVRMADSTYAAAKGQPMYRERYMDNTARLRRLKPAVEEMQKGETAMGQEKYDQARSLFSSALKKAPEDYTGLVLMAKCLLMEKKPDEADKYLSRAQAVYPQESQAHYLAGYVDLDRKRFESALVQFERYDKQLPGNPAIAFFKGYAYEGLDRKKPAAENYYRYLQAVNQGDNAKYAYKKLVAWGYLKPGK
ncbi:MAG: M48 family metalloprotease [Desulfosarcinaceae bacterium]